MKGKNYSILRDEEYYNLAKVSINGIVLDIGGSTKSGYHQLIKGSHKIVTANIDSSYGCDLVFDAQNKFPLEDNSYDGVVCMNVLEHIFGFQNVFSESFRVLKKDGTLVMSTPFFFHIHGSPDDYFRYTKSAFVRLLVDAGFKDIQIEEMGRGVLSALFQTVGGSLPGFLRIPCKNIVVSLDKFLCNISGSYRTLSLRIPLGYFVIARKG